MITEEKLIEGCKRYKREAQNELYNKYAPKLRALCYRYSKNADEAEDILQEGMIKVFDNIITFKGLGSLENWIRRIVINTAIKYYYKSKKNGFYEEISESDSLLYKNNIYDNVNTEEENDIDLKGFSANDLINIISELPEGYRMVFNMFVIDDMKHKEIGEVLGIDEVTSRSQLSRAKNLIRKKLNEKVNK